MALSGQQVFDHLAIQICARALRVLVEDNSDERHSAMKSFTSTLRFARSAGKVGVRSCKGRSTAAAASRGRGAHIGVFLCRHSTTTAGACAPRCLADRTAGREYSACRVEC